ncbi:arylsulfotransferase family protein [Halomicroarcula sp. F13]|uniref:Arylsulfotransferase family protein n=3 Tax=Haloarcula TaxID=2237 RepID=A0A8J8CAR8_9EURY|nr:MULTISPECIES: arylsulfotransferase family protein [Haloarculaceae]MBX0305519.1 arylsulfotransferase family protein [Halomicroarcula salinisoli]MBX0324813.1 arylsulfotransferase family protein [Halomicroarcula rubra]MDS0261751.1 arylsulfotransferase family protein [Haloarcula sp. S1CR25-12]
MASKSFLRIFFIIIIGLSSIGLAYGYTLGATNDTFESHLTNQGVANPQQQAVEPRDNITVVATDSNSWRGEASSGPRARAELVAFNPDGSILYYNDSHTRYWDVDPVPETRTTVEYMFADHLEPSACPNTTNFVQRRVDEEVWNEYEAARSTDACTRNGYERVNLTTGEVTRVWSETTPGKEATRYHDADRLNETHLAVADIYLDRVFVVNTTSGQTEWTWNASSAFPRETGGPYPEDWTHINDIEVLEDGRLMVSARNQDRVVFLNRSGLIEGWTLGEEDNYSILYEQHNPDYIPTERGGPAVLVGDSENNRVVEYQRTGDSWEQSWVWRDTRMQWPRDADRLPNGHTLITDSNGNRVFEVDKQGEVVWSVNIAFPYEAERLGTGDESAGGPSATQANLDSRTGSLRDSLLIIAKQLIPGKYLNGLMYITPVWMGFLEVLELVVLLTSCLLWAGIEIVWRRQS